MAATANASALRALNSAFVRKGIVATSDCEPHALPDTVRSLLDALQRASQLACEDARDVANIMQLWKERSLHQTLEALDAAAANARNDSKSNDSSTQRAQQIEAIEMHERAGRALTEQLQRHRRDAAHDVQQAIDAFAQQLADVLAELIRPELADALAHEQTINQQLVTDNQQLETDKLQLETDKQQLESAYVALVQSNCELEARLDAIENAPDGGGDAMLCTKLRARVQALTAREHELQATVAANAADCRQHQWTAQQLRQDLEHQQLTLALTKAMHDKETKQLVALVQRRQQQQFAAVALAGDCGTGPSRGLAVYDPVSRRTVQFATSPQKPLTAHRRVASPLQSPVRSQQYQLQSVDPDNVSVAAQPMQPASPRVQSPIGHVRRRFVVAAPSDS